MKDFTTGNITKPLMAFAAPMMIGNLFQQLYSIVDAIIVGRFVSGDALAAVGVSMSIIFFLTSALIGLTTGAAVLISQFFGAKQYDRLRSAVSVSILFHSGLAILLTALGVIFAPQMLHLLGTDQVIFDDALQYMRISLFGIIFTMFFNMYTAYMRALGDSRTPLYILIFSVILSGILTIYLVAVQGMGVFGAAISTVFAQLVASVLSYVYASKRAKLLTVEKLIFDMSIFKLIVKYGAPAAVQMSLVSLAHLLIIRLINSFGPAAMAGITAVTRIDQLAIMPIATLSMAMSTFVAQNMGADLEERAKKGFRATTLYMVAGAVFMSAILMVFAPELISLFLDQNDVNLPEILSVGQTYMSIMVVFYFMFAFLFAFNGFFRGVGDAMIAMIFPVVSLIIRTLSAYGLVHLAGMGPEALAWSIPIGWGLCSIGSWVYYKKRLWVGKVATK